MVVHKILILVVMVRVHIEQLLILLFCYLLVILIVFSCFLVRNIDNVNINVYNNIIYCIIYFLTFIVSINIQNHL